MYRRCASCISYYQHRSKFFYNLKLKAPFFPTYSQIFKMGTVSFSLQGLPWSLEDMGSYAPGGHHPIHLGDDISARYRVLHKLGNGGFGNVWLCRDLQSPSPKYLALKVLMAKASTEVNREIEQMARIKDLAKVTEDAAAKYICLPLDTFNIEGPNGSHICFVYPLLGPKLSFGLLSSSPDLSKALRGLCAKVVKAVAFLHRNGICHGDLTASNILHSLVGIDGLPEDQVLEIFGTPRRNMVDRVPGGPYVDAAAPGYLVYPVTWDHLDIKYVGEDPSIVDFGESFQVSNPPPNLGLPGNYRSPELMLDGTVGVNVDLWALGCTLFEIRTGRKLFAPFDQDDDGFLEIIVDTLGVLPEPWWSSTWRLRSKLYKDAPNGRGQAVFANAPDETSSDATTSERKINVHPSVAQDARSLAERVAPGVWYLHHDDPRPEYHQGIDHEEIEKMVDLLGRLLEYEPNRRMAAAEASKHPWLLMNGSDGFIRGG